MDDYEEKYSRLLSLLKDLRIASEALLIFSQQEISLLSESDDDAIFETLKEREKYISALMNLENEIDLVIEEAGFDYDNLPEDAEVIRLSIRSVLDRVTEIDIAAINLLRGNLQKYKEYTIRARNKKNVSAYFKTNIARPEGKSFDLEK